jgi:predicted transcriptional regulator
MRTNIHIGELIRIKLQEEGRTIPWFAKKMSHSPSGIYKLLNKETLNTEQLERICMILNFNFFIYYYESINRNLRKEK